LTSFKERISSIISLTLDRLTIAVALGHWGDTTTCDLLAMTLTYSLMNIVKAIVIKAHFNVGSGADELQEIFVLGESNLIFWYDCCYVTGSDDTKQLARDSDQERVALNAVDGANLELNLLSAAVLIGAN
jgi:hypothetical protein